MKSVHVFLSSSLNCLFRFSDNLPRLADFSFAIFSGFSTAQTRNEMLILCFIQKIADLFFMPSGKIVTKYFFIKNSFAATVGNGY